MTFEEMLEALGDFEAVPVEAIAVASADWASYGPRFRALLHSYVAGQDESELKERALYCIVHVLGEKADTAAFADLCRLCEDDARFNSVYGPDAAVASSARILTSTFGGDPAPLERLACFAGAGGDNRCSALLVLAYLTCHGLIAEKRSYQFLEQLSAGLPRETDESWYGYARAVAALGFAGLAGAVDGAYKLGLVPDGYYDLADFWGELQASQSGGRDVSGPDWDDIRPIGSAVDQLQMLMELYEEPEPGGSAEAHYAAQMPVRNPLKSLGRNDPCPCGSGAKYKKCCLQAGS